LCAPTTLCAGPTAPPPTGTGGATSPLPATRVSPAQPTAAIIESTIYDEFDGWTGETVFKLDNGQYWKQVSYAYTYHYAYRPGVQIVRENGVYRLHVDGVNDAITVELITVVADTKIAGDFNGWDGDTIFQLSNGQVWQQSAPAIATSVALQPQALIYCDSGHFTMQVDGREHHSSGQATPMSVCCLAHGCRGTTGIPGRIRYVSTYLPRPRWFEI
jgi:hypothetical protein